MTHAFKATLPPLSLKVPEGPESKSNKSPEKKTIGEILSSPETYNYSIRTGELLGQNTHLIVIDIDLKVGTHKITADKLLSIFKGYYTVKTPSGGYHIYLKVMSEEKFKSQHLLTLRGEQTTIEILAEKKKAMGPGSLIDGKMYSRIKGKNYNSSLSFKIILRKELVSKLKEAGLLIGSQYKPYDYGDKDIEVLNIGDRNRLISAITDAKIKEKSIKFVSLVRL